MKKLYIQSLVAVPKTWHAWIDTSLWGHDQVLINSITSVVVPTRIVNNSYYYLLVC